MLGESALFPGGWDPSRDLLVVVGRGAEPLLAQLAAQGQRRVLLYLPEEVHGVRAPEPARVVHTPIALFDHVLALARPLPTRVLVQRQSDPWVSDEVYAEVSRTVDDSLRSRRLQSARRDRFGPLRLLQAAAALPSIASHASVAVLDGAFAKRACFLVSPGPSLDQNAATLREVKGRALVVASTRALAPLAAQGVVPDLVIAAAPQVPPSHCDGVELSGVEALLIGATCDPAHWRMGARRRLAFGDGDRLDAWVFEPFGEDAFLRTGGSVACTALSLALRMACDPVVFVGQDLAFTDQRVYSPSSAGGGARIQASEDGHSFAVVDPSASAEDEPERGRLVKVAGSKGGLVLTSETYRSYLTWFETVARSLEGRTLLINATEGGANIRGMQHRRLSDVIADYVRGEVDVAGVLERRTELLDASRRRHLAAAAVERTLAGLSACLELAKRCRVLAGEARGDAGRLRELHETEDALRSALRAAPLLSLMAPEEILAAEERVQAARALEPSLAAAEMLYGVVERAGGTLREPLAGALGELR